MRKNKRFRNDAIKILIGVTLHKMMNSDGKKREFEMNNVCQSAILAERKRDAEVKCATSENHEINSNDERTYIQHTRTHTHTTEELKLFQL